MITRNNKTTSSIFKGNQTIDKVMKGTLVVYEAFKKLIASGVPPITLKKCKNSNLIDYKIYGNSEKKQVLPNEYQQVEYIETTGTQYIDSGVPLKNGLKTIVDWIYEETTTSNSYTGAHIGSPGNRWLIGSQRQNNNYFFAVGTGNTTTGLAFGNRDIVEAYWENKGSYIKVNGVQSTSSFDHLTLTEEPNYTFYIGAVNRDGNASSKSKLTIYNWKFYQDNVLIRDFIPCYRKSDNEIGIYDLVNDKFYTNKGTGVFLKGNEIATEIESVGDYYETTGKYTIPIKVNDAITNIYLNEPLRKMGGYADYIDYKNQKVIKLVDKKTFDGSENWELHTTISGGCVFRLDGVLTPLLNAPQTSTHMTHFDVTNIYSTSKFGVGLYRFSSNTEVTKITGNRLYVSSSHTTVEDFKEWLSQNKPSIYYPLETTIEETIELPNILLNKGTNIIEVDTNILPSNMVVEYYSKSVIQLLDETTNNILNDILDGDTKTEKDISDAEIEQILDEIIGG
jgi:hypothetical protein